MGSGRRIWRCREGGGGEERCLFFNHRGTMNTEFPNRIRFGPPGTLYAGDEFHCLNTDLFSTDHGIARRREKDVGGWWPLTPALSPEALLFLALSGAGRGRAAFAVRGAIRVSGEAKWRGGGGARCGSGAQEVWRRVRQTLLVPDGCGGVLGLLFRCLLVLTQESLAKARHPWAELRSPFRAGGVSDEAVNLSGNGLTSMN